MGHDEFFPVQCFGRRALGALALSGLSPGPAAAMPLPGTAVSHLGDALLHGAGLRARPAAHVFSPFDVYVTLGLLALGSRGRTAAEFTRLLGAGGSAVQLATLLTRERTAVVRADPAIELGCSAWVTHGRSFSRSWRDLAQHAADPRLGTLDFASPGAVPAINAWVARATRGQIPTILDHLPSQAELVLASAIHFAGTWACQFRPEDTAPLPFQRLDGGASPVPTMQGMTTAEYGADALGHAVRLDYRGGRLAFWAATAQRPEDADRFFDTLAVSGTTNWLQALPMRTSQVMVRLPKLELATGGDILPALRTTSYGHVLNGNFSGILGRPVKPTQVLHRARIHVDERGTVAAAATAVVGTRSMPRFEEFSADRPFVFVLGLTRPWLPLFMGYVGDAASA